MAKSQLEKSIFQDHQVDSKLVAEEEVGEIKHNNPSSSSSSLELDPKLVYLLEFFQELYERKGDLFRKMVPVRREELVELLKKMMGNNIENNQHTGRGRPYPDGEGDRHLLYKRSYSIGATRGINLGTRPDDLRLQRFKIKTLDTAGEIPGGFGAGGGVSVVTKPGGGDGGGHGHVGGGASK